MLHRLAFVLALLIAGSAWGQSTAPSVETFMGASLGMQWLPAAGMRAGVNSQTGTTYTVLATDIGKLIVFNNGSAIAVTLPQAGTPGFEVNKTFCLVDLGAGTATVTPTTSTINGASNKAYAQNASGCIVSDGTNYFSH